MNKLVTFETAKLAKGKGFDVYCYEYWIDKDTQTDEHYKPKLVKELKDKCISAPTQSVLQTWLREEHNIDVEMSSWGEVDLFVQNSPLVKNYVCKVSNWNVRWSVHDGTGIVMPERYHFDGNGYENIFELGLLKALTLIKND